MTIPPAIRQMAQTVKYQEVSMSHQEKNQHMWDVKQDHVE